MAEGKENSRVTGLMSWVRIVLPIALAGLGWYIGQTVGNLDQRLDLMESKDASMRETMIEHIAGQEAWHKEVERRLTSHALTVEDMVTMTQFLQRAEAHDRHLERLEDRINGQYQ